MTTVRQLIEQLQQHDPDERVVPWDWETHGHLDVDLRVYPVGIFTVVGAEIVSATTVGIDWPA